jgi:hypothetical protein
MSTQFRGLKTGFNPSGSNECCPNEMGPPTTKFSGRGALPEGPLKRYPGAVADTSGGNRRLAKSNHGDGGGSGTRFSGSPSGFSRGRK